MHLHLRSPCRLPCVTVMSRKGIPMPLGTPIHYVLKRVWSRMPHKGTPIHYVLKHVWSRMPLLMLRPLCSVSCRMPGRLWNKSALLRVPSKCPRGGFMEA